MSKLTEAYRSVGVYNPHHFANGEVYITWQNLTGRGHTFQGWRVHKQGVNLGKAWYDHESRGFSTFTHGGGGKNLAEYKAHALAVAKAWAAEQFGITEWARTPYGDYMDAAYVERRMAEIHTAVLKVQAEALRVTVATRGARWRNKRTEQSAMVRNITDRDVMVSDVARGTTRYVKLESFINGYEPES